jgi:hypothetical protein
MFVLTIPSIVRLCSLSTDLYASPSRFLLEFIQNAADNKYADGVTPTLNMTVNEDFIIFQCNEVGFSAANVEAICKIGASTKNKNGFIGWSSHIPPRDVDVY